MSSAFSAEERKGDIVSRQNAVSVKKVKKLKVKDVKSSAHLAKDMGRVRVL